MVNSNLIQQLRARGIIAQVTDEQALSDRLSIGQTTLYCGFDPTADSLHLGHLLPLLCLKRFQLAGHHPIALVGGATGLIGDPSFKSTERIFKDNNLVQKWVEKIKQQISLFLDFNCGNNSAITVDNYDWFSDMNVLTFLRTTGKHFSVNQMINKEAIKQRLYQSESGISYTEFSYNLMQSYDFAWLNKKFGVILQIGGSDQWGNITSGISLTRKLYHKKVFGLTVPLIIKADGTKFSKTENNAVWLDSNKTSPYKFYQFWINTPDKDVYRFLKFFTFLSLPTIQAIEQQDREKSGPPSAQYILAEEVTRIVHGQKGLAAAKRITTSLFNNTLANLTEDDFIQLARDGIPTVDLKRGADLQQALVAADLALSRRQAHTLICSNAVTVNGERHTSNYVFRDTDRMYGRFSILRKGKKYYCLLNWK